MIAIELLEPVRELRWHLVLIDDAIVIQIVLVDQLLDPARSALLAHRTALRANLCSVRSRLGWWHVGSSETCQRDQNGGDQLHADQTPGFPIG